VLRWYKLENVHVAQQHIVQRAALHDIVADVGLNRVEKNLRIIVEGGRVVKHGAVAVVLSPSLHKVCLEFLDTTQESRTNSPPNRVSRHGQQRRTLHVSRGWAPELCGGLYRNFQPNAYRLYHQHAFIDTRTTD